MYVCVCVWVCVCGCVGMGVGVWVCVCVCVRYKKSVVISLVDVYLKWLNWLHFLILEGGLLVILIECMIFLSPFLPS